MPAPYRGAEQLDDRAAAPRAPRIVRDRRPARAPRDAHVTARAVEVRRGRVGCRAGRLLGRRRQPHRLASPATLIGHFAGRTDDSAPDPCVHVLTIQLNTPTPAAYLEPVLHARQGLRRSGSRSYTVAGRAMTNIPAPPNDPVVRANASGWYQRNPATNAVRTVSPGARNLRRTAPLADRLLLRPRACRESQSGRFPRPYCR